MAAEGMLRVADDVDTDRMSRRDLVKLGLALGAAGASTATGVALLEPLIKGLPETATKLFDPADHPERFVYTRFPTPQWWNARAGEPIRVTDFQEWQGATGVWRGVFNEGRWVPGTGFPVLVIRVKRDDAVFVAPPRGAVSLPGGFNLYYDDPARDLRIVVVYDRCAHLCCVPGWQVVQDPPPARDYLSDAPTYRVYGLDPVYCVCHGSQFDPMVLVTDVNPRNGVTYVGPSRVHGPSSRSIPIVPVDAVGDVLIGGMPDPSWYDYC